MFLTTRNNDASRLERRISRFFNDALTSLDWQYRDSAAAAWVPPVDIFEEADSIRIMAEVPGVKPEDVKISLEGNVLTIHGTKQQGLRAHLHPAGYRGRGAHPGAVRKRRADRDPAEDREGQAPADSGRGGESVTAWGPARRASGCALTAPGDFACAARPRFRDA